MSTIQDICYNIAEGDDRYTTKCTQNGSQLAPKIIESNVNFYEGSPDYIKVQQRNQFFVIELVYKNSKQNKMYEITRSVITDERLRGIVDRGEKYIETNIPQDNYRLIQK